MHHLQRFTTIPKADQLLIRQAFTPIMYKAGHILSKAGEKATVLYFINKGLLEITLPRAGQRDAIYYFMREHQFMGFLYSYYDDVPALQGLKAIVDTELLSIAIADLHTLYISFPYLKDAINKMTHVTMADMINCKNAYLGLTAIQKYQLLLELQPEVAMAAALGDIASYLDITPQSLSRIRRQLSR
ncbi:Crp/Fnr family transcriptional regulator [Deminuibacter soli]|uniref:Crp/Fnr family transcriptional regulator n=2 Tax=Deminuibacter soli TaxID=2291815 RepID=A0A3E1NE88_9BACT|nr:Crp/Fnr family transcriptional regulator [Deminuibacter soli]